MNDWKPITETPWRTPVDHTGELVSRTWAWIGAFGDRADSRGIVAGLPLPVCTYLMSLKGHEYRKLRRQLRRLRKDWAKYFPYEVMIFDYKIRKMRTRYIGDIR